MSDALRQLLAVFDVDSGKAVAGLKTIDGAIGEVAGRLGGLVTAFIGSSLVGGLKDFVDGQIAAAREVRLTAAKLGVGTEELEHFSFAAGSAGVSSEGAANALKFLNKNMGLALEGNQESVQTFKKLDVALKNSDGSVRELGDVLPEVANAFQKMGSQQERTTTAMKIFGRQGADLIPLLEGGAEGLDKLRDRFEELGGGMSEDFIAKAKEAGKAMSGMKFGIEAFKRQIAVEFFPVVAAYGQRMQTVISYVNKFAKETNLAKEIFVVFGAAASIASAKAYIGMAKFLGILPKGAGFNLKTIFDLGWWGLIIAAVALAALVFEDLWTSIAGGDGLIKKWLQETLGIEDTEVLFDQFKQIVDQIGVSFDSMSPAVKSLLKSMAEIAVSPYFVATIEFIVRLLGSMVALLIAAARAAGNIVSGDLTGAGKAIDQGGDAVFGKNGFFGDNAFKPYSPSASVRNPTSQSRGGDVNQENSTVIQVNGAGDPKSVAAAVADEQRGVFANQNAAAVAALNVGLTDAGEL